jgi:hypothetical protein
MKKRKSTRETKNMIQTALWLPRGMHERLKKSGGERGMGEEIRRVLEEAMKSADASQTPDGITTELLDQIRDVIRDHPDWHTDRFVFDVLKAAIKVLLSNHEPTGEGKPETKARLQALYGQETADAIGSIIGFVAIKAYARERYGSVLLEKLKEQI